MSNVHVWPQGGDQHCFLCVNLQSMRVTPVPHLWLLKCLAGWVLLCHLTSVIIVHLRACFLRNWNNNWSFPELWYWMSVSGELEELMPNRSEFLCKCFEKKSRNIIWPCRFVSVHWLKNPSDWFRVDSNSAPMHITTNLLFLHSPGCQIQNADKNHWAHWLL